MANTYTLIASNTLSSSAASVTFSSIPATYTDLVLRCSTRSSVAGDGNGPFYLTINADAASNYSNTNLQGNGASASSNSQSSVSFGVRVGLLDSTTNTADSFASQEIYIPSYLVSQNKPLSSFSATETNATQAFINAHAGLWRNTAAITSLKLDGVTFASGSSFFLYGIKNS